MKKSTKEIKYSCTYDLSKGSEFSAGIDVRVTRDVTIHPGETVKLDSLLSIEIPKGHYGLLVPRSSFGLKGLYMHTGIIDSDYRGNISFVISNYNKKSWLNDNSVFLESNERIGQLIIQPYLRDISLVKSESLSPTKRDKGGFGSTGKK